VTDAALTGCALCGEADPLGAGLCPACLGTGAGRRTLLFLRDGTQGDALDPVLGPVPNRAEIRAALRAGRPLLAVPAAIAARVLGALEAHGVPARGVPSDRAWRALPAPFGIMLLAVGGAGAVAGLVAVPALLWATPVFALLLLLFALRSLGRPALSPADDALPGALRADVAVTLVGIEPGPVRSRLVDLLRIAGPLAAGIAAQGDPARLRESIHDLIRAACDTARETDRLTGTADVIRSSLVWTTEVAGEEQAGSARSALRRASELAANGLARMADAVSALGRIDADAATLDGPVGAELAELTRGLEAAARVHVETFRALNELVA
jgi:hypothetical protein